MISQIVAASPTIAIACASVAVLLALCAATVVTTALRAAEPKDIPRIIATVCRALPARRRR